MEQRADVVDAWHRVVASRSPEALAELLADDVVFESPVVHTPQVGRAKTTAYLLAAFQVLNTPAFRYVGRWDAPGSAVLAFTTQIDGVIVDGVDIIDWDDRGRIRRFKVMVRPLKAIGAVHDRMRAELQRAGASPAGVAAPSGRPT